MKASEINSLDDFIKAFPIESKPFQNPKEESEKELYKVVFSAKVPEWLDDINYERSVIIRMNENGDYNAFDKNGEIFLTGGKDIEDFYSVIQEKVENFYIDDDVSNRPSLIIGQKYGRLIMSRDDARKLFYFKNSLYEISKTVEKYYNNPTDFYNSYNFIKNHLVFWTKPKKSVSALSLYSNVPAPEFYKEKDGKVICVMETSVHSIDYTSFGYDYNLDVVSDTYENAVIELAHLITVYYNDDGTPKELSSEEE